VCRWLVGPRNAAILAWAVPCGLVKAYRWGTECETWSVKWEMLRRWLWFRFTFTCIQVQSRPHVEPDTHMDQILLMGKFCIWIGPELAQSTSNPHQMTGKSSDSTRDWNHFPLTADHKRDVRVSQATMTTCRAAPDPSVAIVNGDAPSATHRPRSSSLKLLHAQRT
jgi:hypothetical protein